jgi:hypothetical protein
LGDFLFKELFPKDAIKVQHSSANFSLAALLQELVVIKEYKLLFSSL